MSPKRCVCVVLVVASTAAGCVFKSEIDGPIAVSCRTNDECPPGFVCRPNIERCIPIDEIGAGGLAFDSIAIEPTLGGAGSVFRLSLRVSGALLEDPTVTVDLGARIASFLIDENASDRENGSYVYLYTATGNEPEGTRNVEIFAIDRAGNDAKVQRSLTFDFSGPRNLSFHLSKTRARAQEWIVLSATMSEALSSAPVVRMIGEDETLVSWTLRKRERETFEFEYRTTGDEAEGSYDIRITSVDAAQNENLQTLSRALTLDFSPPEIAALSALPTRVQKGSTIAFNLIFNEPVRATPKLEIMLDGVVTSSITFSVHAEGDRTFSYSHIVGEHEDGEMTLSLREIYDLVGNAAPNLLLGTVEIDSTPPTLGDFWQNKSAVNKSDVFVVEFHVTEPLSNPPSVRVAGVPMNLQSSSAPDTHRFELEMASFSLLGMYPIEVDLRDEVGNSAQIVAGTVLIDTIAPSIIRGSAVAVLFPAPSNPLRMVSKVRGDTRVVVSFVATEALELGCTVLRTQDPEELFFEPLPSVPPYYAFEMIGEPRISGRHVLIADLCDLYGNRTNEEVEMTNDLEVDLDPPLPPSVDYPGWIVLARAPWGSESSGPNPQTRIEIESSALPETEGEMFVFHSPSEPRTTLASQAIDLAREDKLIVDLGPIDRSEVYLAQADLAGNLSEVVRVRDVRWTASFGFKQPGNLSSNPHTFSAWKIFPFLLLPSTSAGMSEVGTFELSARSDGRSVTTSGAATWRKREPSQTPQPRAQHGMVYDSARGVVTLFGGVSNPTMTDETWEWENDHWIQRFPSLTPSRRYGFAMAHDSKRGQTVLFGGQTASGLNQETFAWNGESWQSLSSEQKPSPRAFGAMVYDSKAKHIMLFGGHVLGGYFSNDMWIFDGREWTIQNEPSLRPEPRARYAMAYDEAREVTVLFGGSALTSSGYNMQMDDLWEWNGTTWTKIERIGSEPWPTGRVFHRMSYDRARGEMLMYGGGPYNGPSTRELWAWRGPSTGRWALLSTMGPNWSHHHGMAYDPIREETLISGGYVPSGYQLPSFHGIWAWDGAQWNDRKPSQVPGDFRFGHRVAQEPADGTIALLGGATSEGGVMDQAWNFDGERWRLIDAPDVYVAESVVFPDPVSQRVLSFGGFDVTYCEGCSMAATNMFLAKDPHGTWAPLVAAVPPMRAASAVATCGANTYLFGGYKGSLAGETGQLLGDTWLWDGQTWTELHPDEAPSPRAYHAMACDPSTNLVVLYGGVSNGDGQDIDISDANAMSDTWIFDGQNWIELQNDELGSRFRHSMTFDPVLEKIVLFGGNQSEKFDDGFNQPAKDIWILDGETWVEVPVVSTPEPVISPAIAMSKVKERDKLHLFGATFNPWSPMQTWVFDYGVGRTPGHVARFDLSSVGFAQDARFSSLKALFVSGGSGLSAGVELFGWKKGQWTPLVSSSASASAPAPLEFATEDENAIDDLVFRSTLNFAVAPTFPSESVWSTSVVRTDYVEIQLEYSRP